MKKPQKTSNAEHKTYFGQTLNPVFRFSREEQFDDLQKSHQTSTLSLPRESPNLVNMPKSVPSYVMADVNTIPNYQLVRRRIDYQETAEYRVMKPNGSTSTSGTTKSLTSTQRPLNIVVEEYPLRDFEDSLSTVSDESTTIHRMSQTLAEPKDRLLRSTANRTQYNNNYTKHESQRYPDTPQSSTPLSHVSLNSRETAKRRVHSIEPEDGVSEYRSRLRSSRLLTPQLPKQASDQFETAEKSSSTNKIWHLSSMVGLAIEPTPTDQTLRFRQSTSISSPHTQTPPPLIHHKNSPKRLSLRSLILNIIAIPLVLVHCISSVAKNAWKSGLKCLCGLFTAVNFKKALSKVTTYQSYGMRSNFPGSGDQNVGTYSTTQHRSHGSDNFFSCCWKTTLCLFLLLALCCGLLIVGFLTWPSENFLFDESRFLVGVLPSEAQCNRLLKDRALSPESSVQMRMLSRWTCLYESLLKPTAASVGVKTARLWELFKTIAPATTIFQHKSNSNSNPLTESESFDDLLSKLTAIDNRMTELNQEVVDLRKLNQERREASNKARSVFRNDINHIQEAVVNLKQQIAVIVDKRGEVDDQQMHQLTDHLVKQATFVSAVALDTRLNELRGHLETIIDGISTRSSAAPIDDEQNIKIERFAKALTELSALVTQQKTDLEVQLLTLKRDLEVHKAEEVSKFATLNSEIQGDIVAAKIDSHKDTDDLQSRLSADIGKMYHRIGSIEHLSHELEGALKRLSDEVASLRASGSAEQKNPNERIDAVLEAMKSTFAENVEHDLRLKISKELTDSVDSASDLQLKLVHLIKVTVDERMEQLLGDTPQLKRDSDSGDLFAYVDSNFALLAADGTGKADFALESAGGTVVSTRCTKTYDGFKSAISLFGINIAYLSRSPNTILQPTTYPGECWCFHGSEGHVIIRLAVPTHVTGVSLEHISKSVSLYGHIDSAPRAFVIKALESDFASDGEVLGSFIYDKDGKPIQHFSVNPREDGQPTSFIEVVIVSNHGHPTYTCIYRVRVHGSIPSAADEN